MNTDYVQEVDGPRFRQSQFLPDGNSRCRAGQGNRSGQRHWLRITGLPGWRRAQLGLPAFGKAACIPNGRSSRLAAFWRRLRAVLRWRSMRASLPVGQK